MVYLGRTATVAFPQTFTHGVDAYLEEKTQVNICYLCSLWHEELNVPGISIIGCREHHSDPVRLHVAAAVHKDCFVIAKQSCPLAPRLACERIWELAVARSPWPQGQRFQHPKSLSLESQYLISPQAVNKVASIVDIPPVSYTHLTLPTMAVV